MFQRNELQIKFLNLELSHGLIMIFRDLCHIEISCSTKWFNLQHHQINIYIPSSGTVLCQNKGKVKLDIFKYLGVLVDSTLSWKPHITELSKKLTRTTGIFFKIRDYVSYETLKLSY